MPGPEPEVSNKVTGDVRVRKGSVGGWAPSIADVRGVRRALITYLRVRETKDYMASGQYAEII